MVQVTTLVSPAKARPLLPGMPGSSVPLSSASAPGPVRITRTQLNIGLRRIAVTLIRLGGPVSHAALPTPSSVIGTSTDKIRQTTCQPVAAWHRRNS